MADETAVTIIGRESQPYPSRPCPAIVELKAAWADDWVIVPELELVTASVALASQGLDSCTVSRRYGYIKHPWESAFSAKFAWGNLAGWWLRISLVGEESTTPIWIGRISDDSRHMHGSAAHGPSGRQQFTAYGPLQILRKIGVSQSWWRSNSDANLLDWVPGMNECTDRANVTAPDARRRGNRARYMLDGETTYLYGGDKFSNNYEWTNREYAEYLLANFCDESDDDGPAWKLGGQADVLKDLADTIPMQKTQSVADILRKLISRERGMDYVVFADEDGFVVWVVTLSAEAYSFGEKTLPANPRRVQLTTDQTTDWISADIVTSDDHGYKKVRVLGGRVVVCCTLWGAEVVVAPEGLAGTLIGKWRSSLETEYQQGTGDSDDTGDAHDDYRRQDRFRPVYQVFAAPYAWDFNEWTCIPVLDESGQPTDETLAGELTEETVDYQRSVRKTLSTLPLREGFDYTVDPPVEDGTMYCDFAFLPPAVWVGGADRADPFNDEIQAFTPAEAYGINVHALATEWGVRLEAHPNHLTAQNHFSCETYATNTAPLFDYENLVATIAFETGYRLKLVAELEGALPSDGVLDVPVDDAEFWWLAPNTAVGVDSAGHLKLSGETGRVLRNDAERLELVMAGVISRYRASRTRASVAAKGLIAWPLLVGQLLTVVDTGGQTSHIPITHVTWNQSGGASTSLKAGFAQ